MAMKESNTFISVPTSAPAGVTPFNTRRQPFDREEATAMTKNADHRNGNSELNAIYIPFIRNDFTAGVEIPGLNGAEMVDPTSCSRNARRNVATIFGQLVIDDFRADFVKGNRFTAHILHLLESTRQEQQYELFKACEVVSLPRNDLLGRGKDKEFVMQWLRDPSNEHLGTEAFAQVLAFGPPMESKSAPSCGSARAFNNINGDIPYSISKLKKLENLILKRNQLTGPIPSTLSQIPN
ncbi:hypothetical protein KFK09_021271 [Dendrobium nobile]|uniref:Uncharacterized protein n=1 Tax=Dendrobium nobile TaxID=94219 RepID=A0A8T3APJ3_DENNO|nr:hypothetical protein KFK09_021271 [Dendrobium nobile]